MRMMSSPQPCSLVPLHCPSAACRHALHPWHCIAAVRACDSHLPGRASPLTPFSRVLLPAFLLRSSQVRSDHDSSTGGGLLALMAARLGSEAGVDAGLRFRSCCTP